MAKNIVRAITTQFIAGADVTTSFQVDASGLPESCFSWYLLIIPIPIFL